MGTLRYFDLEKLKNDYNCDFLVETGTFEGDSVKYASSFSFKKIFSIEIYYSKSVQKMVNNVLNFCGEQCRG